MEFTLHYITSDEVIFYCIHHCSRRYEVRGTCLSASPHRRILAHPQPPFPVVPESGHSFLEVKYPEAIATIARLSVFCTV